MLLNNINCVKKLYFIPINFPLMESRSQYGKVIRLREQKWALCEKGMGYNYYAFISIPKEVWGSSKINKTDKYNSCEKCINDDDISLMAFADYVWSEFTEDQKYKLCFLAISKNVNDLLYPFQYGIWMKKVQKLINHAFRDGGYLDLSKIEDTIEEFIQKCSSNFVKHRDIFLDLFKRTLKNNGMKLKDLVNYDLIDAFDTTLQR